jgi:hypothetical protein
MVVRIRLSSAIKVRPKQRKNRHVALALASLLTPAAVMACVLVCWRLAADLNVTGQFPIASGLFSHWQIWLTLAASLQFLRTLLNRYGAPLNRYEKPQAIVPESVEEPERKLANSRY